MIFLGVDAAAGLRGGVRFLGVVTRTYELDLSAHPRWAVILVGTLVAAAGLWLFLKVMKWTLWLLLLLVLVGGLAWAGWELAQG